MPACSTCKSHKVRCNFVAEAGACRKCISRNQTEHCDSLSVQDVTFAPSKFQTQSASQNLHFRNCSTASVTKHHSCGTCLSNILEDEEGDEEEEIISVTKVMGGFETDNAEETIPITASLGDGLEDEILESDKSEEEVLTKRSIHAGKKQQKSTPQSSVTSTKMCSGMKRDIEESAEDPAICCEFTLLIYFVILRFCYKAFNIDSAMKNSDNSLIPLTIQSNVTFEELCINIGKKLNRFPGLLQLQYRLDNDKPKTGPTSIQTEEELKMFME